jgi:integrase
MRLPKYRLRPDRDYAFVEYLGKRVPLPGKKNSKESTDAYLEFCRELLNRQESGTPSRLPGASSTIAILVRDYLLWAKTYYKDSRDSTGEYALLRYASRPLVRLYGSEKVGDFGPTKLKLVRDAMISGCWLRADEGGGAWSRPYVNAQVNRIRRIFRWGVEHELVQPTVLEGLRSVPSLKAGRTEAREPQPVQPVSAADVEAVLPHLTAVVSAMVRLQKITAMRSDNLCSLRWCDVDRSGSIWIYRPRRHKTSWRGKSLAIPLGPQSQEILQAFLDRPGDAWLFSPKESEVARIGREKRRQARAPKRTPGDRFTTRSYRRSVIYGIKAANRARVKDGLPPVEEWTPHQLRHARATEIRKKYGIEAARVSLGHARVEATEIYAELNLEQALRIAGEIG